VLEVNNVSYTYRNVHMFDVEMLTYYWIQFIDMLSVWIFLQNDLPM